MIENEDDARQEISTPSKCREFKASDIIDADVSNNTYASGILIDSVFARTLRDRPGNEDRIRGVV